MTVGIGSARDAVDVNENWIPVDRATEEDRFLEVLAGILQVKGRSFKEFERFLSTPYSRAAP